MQLGLPTALLGVLTTVALAIHNCRASWPIQAIAWSPNGAAATLRGWIAVASNLLNNLPSDLIASATIKADHLPQTDIDSLLIGVD
jgi:arsenical pump membrane protein